MTSRRLLEKVASLPTGPGVYLFRDAAGELLYVGKARSLRSRVRSYFRDGKDRRLATRFIARRVADVEFVATRSEKEALLLENNLIKRLRPRYNLRLRDDKTYLSLRIDPRRPFARIEAVRRVRRDGARYFGPYANAGALRRTLRFLRSFVPLRDCKDSDFRSRTRPCLEYEIGRCGAPCVGLEDEETYRRHVDRALRILSGRTRELVEEARREMERAARSLQFERAAALRDFLHDLEVTSERQDVDRALEVDADVLGLHREGGFVEIAVLYVRSGKVTRSDAFTFEQDLPDDEWVGEFLERFYEEGRYVPPEVLVPVRPNAEEALRERLAELRGGAVDLVVPRAGLRSRWLEMARENARLALLASSQRRRKSAELIELVRERLGLRRPPVAVEAFDVSTTQGRQTVAVCVRFTDGEPDRSRYRRYRIRAAPSGDEYGAMEEALRRHYSRMVTERRKEVPDLVLVDGGKGQWNVARRVLDEVGLTRVEVAAIAKGARRGRGVLARPGDGDRVFLQGEGEPLGLAPDDPALLFLGRVRDEAHRAAIAYHRRSRSRASLASELDAIPLVGPKRKQILLLRFGSLEGVRRATEEELARTDGIGPKAAREIRRWFERSRR